MLCKSFLKHSNIARIFLFFILTKSVLTTPAFCDKIKWRKGKPYAISFNVQQIFASLLIVVIVLLIVIVIIVLIVVLVIIVVIVLLIVVLILLSIVLH